jgi:hypothetical protein
MTIYDNTNRWTLFRNERKQSDSHADYNGSINIDGVEYWLNGWIKEGKNGKFFSGTVKPKATQSTSAGARQAQPQGRHIPNDMDDEIPFEMEWR